jgi:hypothetical protein
VNRGHPILSNAPDSAAEVGGFRVTLRLLAAALPTLLLLLLVLLLLHAALRRQRPLRHPLPLLLLLPLPPPLLGIFFRSGFPHLSCRCRKLKRDLMPRSSRPSLLRIRSQAARAALAAAPCQPARMVRGLLRTNNMTWCAEFAHSAGPSVIGQSVRCARFARSDEKDDVYRYSVHVLSPYKKP